MSFDQDDPVSFLFLSCDLTGSTNFKQQQQLTASTADAPGEPNRPRPVPWQKVFLQFYREFPQRVRTTQQSEGTKDLKFVLWKPVGDELIYSCAVRSETDVYNAVRTWLRSMRDYEEASLKGTGMGTKGGAFIATFPGPDSRSSVPRFPDLEQSDADVVELNIKAHESPAHDNYVYDYFGPSIDTGFRVISKCSPRYFTLSVEVALAILSRAIAPGGGRDDTDVTDLLLLDFVELKGVWRNQRYPIVAIDAQHKEPVHQAYSKFEHRGSVEELNALCEACYRAEGWPSKLYLPHGNNDFFRIVPTDPLGDYLATTSKGAEEVAEDEPEDAEDLPDILDLGFLSKGEISEGYVAGDSNVHGYAPDGELLCGARGHDGSAPTSTGWPNDDDPPDFNPQHALACPTCVDIYHDLN